MIKLLTTKEIAFLPADHVVIFILNLINASQLSIPCYPEKNRDQAHSSKVKDMIPLSMAQKGSPPIPQRYDLLCE